MFKVNQPKSKSNISRTIRFNEDLFNTLNMIATKEGTSFNALVLQCCEYAIGDYEESDQSVEQNHHNV